MHRCARFAMACLFMAAQPTLAQQSPASRGSQPSAASKPGTKAKSDQLQKVFDRLQEQSRQRAHQEAARIDAEFKAIAAKIRPAGKELVDAGLDPQAQLELAEQAGVQFETYRMFRIPDQAGGIIIAKFRSPAAIEHLTKSRMPSTCGYATWGNVVVIQACPDDIWKPVAEACKEPGTRTGQSPARDAKEIRQRIAMDDFADSQRKTIMNQLELYKLRHGAYPDLVKGQWNPLVGEKYINKVPRNPFAPETAATKIVAAKPGARINPEDAGWAFDQEKGLMYVVGVDE